MQQDAPQDAGRWKKFWCSEPYSGRVSRLQVGGSGASSRWNGDQLVPTVEKRPGEGEPNQIMKTISLMFLLTAGVAQCAEMTPYAAGYRVGYWVVPIGVSLALLMGIAKCFVIARRPSASAKALWALI